MAKIGDKYMNVTYPFEYTEFLIPGSDYKVLVRRDGSGYVENMGKNPLDNIEVIYEPLSDEDHDTFYTLKDKLAKAEQYGKNAYSVVDGLMAENSSLRAAAQSSKDNSIQWRKMYQEMKAKADRLEKLYTDEVGNSYEWAVKAKTLEAILNIKAMNINIPELFKVFSEANVQSACPLVECCVEEYPTEDVISYNCRHKCGKSASECRFCTYYR